MTRSSRERMWAGVAGGLAEYFDVDPTLMRLMWVVATVISAGLFVAVYFVMWVIMPLDTDQPGGPWKPPRDDQPAQQAEGGAAADPAEWERTSSSWGGGWSANEPWWGYGPHYGYHRHGRGKRSAGIVLIVLGLLFLSAHAGVFRFIDGGVAWAVALIILGFALLARRHDWRP